MFPNFAENDLFNVFPCSGVAQIRDVVLIPSNVTESFFQWFNAPEYNEWWSAAKKSFSSWESRYWDEEPIELF